MGEIEREPLLPKRDTREEEDRGEVRGDEEASWVWKVSVSGAIALRHTGLPHRYSGEPEEDSQTSHWGGAQGSQEELPIGDPAWHVTGQGLTEVGVRLKGEKERESKGS